MSSEQKLTLEQIEEDIAETRNWYDSSRREVAEWKLEHKAAAKRLADLEIARLKLLRSELRKAGR